MSDEPIRPVPVIVIHFDTAPGAHLTACTGYPFIPDSGTSWLDVPRVPCPGCLIAARRAEERPAGGPWTRHGHEVPGVTVAGSGRPPVQRCGGPRTCGVCAVEAVRMMQEAGLVR